MRRRPRLPQRLRAVHERRELRLELPLQAAHRAAVAQRERARRERVAQRARVQQVEPPPAGLGPWQRAGGRW